MIVDSYTCIECYTQYLIEVDNQGSSAIMFSFSSDEATTHLEETLADGASHNMTQVFSAILGEES